MTASSLIGYLDDAYLVGPPGYLAGTFGEFTGMQVDLKGISQEPIGQQAEMIVKPEDSVGMQSEMINIVQNKTGMQTEMLIQSPDDDGLVGMQVELVILPEVPTGMQAKIFPLAHWLHGKYLVEDEPYLTTSYLSEKMCAFQGMQAKMFIDSPLDDHFQGMQVDMLIDQQHLQGMQVNMQVFTELLTGFQTEMVRTLKVGAQANYVIYNTTQLRILCEFPSRGTVAEYAGVPSADDANWTTPQTMQTGDLGKLKNLNTDVLEERIQTADGFASNFELRCDSGVSNTFVDTIAILEHNLTTSATVTFQGSNLSNFGLIEFSETLTVEELNMFFIAPTLPTIPARYFRFIIQDSTNPDNNIKIGTIIFGTSQIFSVKECFTNPISFGKTHFKDTINTEGFTNKSNDRATRKRLGLNFEKLEFIGGNYQLLQDMMNFAKTDLKCLIIPRPQTPSRLSVFAKLVALPDEEHTAEDEHFVDLSLDWDESL